MGVRDDKSSTCRLRRTFEGGPGRRAPVDVNAARRTSGEAQVRSTFSRRVPPAAASPTRSVAQVLDLALQRGDAGGPVGSITGQNPDLSFRVSMSPSAKFLDESRRVARGLADNAHRPHRIGLRPRDPRQFGGGPPRAMAKRRQGHGSEQLAQ
jgi:hypothetical protein